MYIWKWKSEGESEYYSGPGYGVQEITSRKRLWILGYATSYTKHHMWEQYD